MKKTFLSLLLALSLAAGLLFTTAAAAGGLQLEVSAEASDSQAVTLSGIPADCQSFQITLTLSNGTNTYTYEPDSGLNRDGIYATCKQNGSQVTLYITAKSGTLAPDGTLTLGTLTADSAFTVTGYSDLSLLSSSFSEIETGGSEDSGGTSSGGTSGTTTYAIAINGSNGGLVTASTAKAGKGSTVTLTAAAQEGYILESIRAATAAGTSVTLTDQGGGKYTFTMPAAAVTVTAVFTAQTTEDGNGDTSGSVRHPFTDVADGTWYSDAVQYVYDLSLMTGTSDYLFSPDVTTSRAMIVTILYRLEGSPAVSGGAAFPDVAEDSWYTDAVAWASANSIVTGYDNGNFGPEDTITREQMATIFYRYASYKGRDTSASAALSGYSDAGQVSSYAEQAMRWAIGTGLITGTSDTTLSPAGSATRAQAAVILNRFCQNLSA